MSPVLVVREGRRWTVRHDGLIVATHRSRVDAEAAARALARPHGLDVVVHGDSFEVTIG